jgi:aromatic-L-amino-acid/L-tryptophan decarboxylase
MSAEDFRRHGHAVVDWIADYLTRVADHPVLSQVEPGWVRSQLPPHPPQAGERFEAVLADVDRIIMPGITHWQHPGWFAYFPANNSGPSILGELLSAGLGIQGMLWSTSPAATELETHVLDWLAEMLGLPQRFRSTGEGGGVIQDTASSAALVALLAARERATGGAATLAGVDRPLTVYTSTQTHSSVEKAVRIAGHGTDRLRLVGVDTSFAMRPELLEQAIVEDLAAGATPCMVVATVGTTSSTAVDPVRSIGQICRRHGVWLHVDAAMAGTAALCPELRWIHDGVELADSYCVNPHKWMFTNFDCDAFWVADRGALVRALSVLPEYLRNTASQSGAVIDYRDWQIPLGRRFRALKLWFVTRHYGLEGLRAYVREHMRLAALFERWVREDNRFEIAAPRTMHLVCFRPRPRPGEAPEHTDARGRALLDRLNASGRIYLTHATAPDADGRERFTLRLAIGATACGERHVRAAWDLVRAAASEV